VRLNDFAHLQQYLATREHNEFSTGIPELDSQHVVPTRSALMMFLAPTTTGKSWWLVQLGLNALLRNYKKVLHVSLELSAEEVLKRYWQYALGCPVWERERKTSVTNLLKDEASRLTGFAKEEIEARQSLQNPLWPELQRQFQNPRSRIHNLQHLMIKKFPMRGIGVGDLRNYLNALEAAEFVPDLLLVDYAGIMQTDSNNYRISLGLILEDLRCRAEHPTGWTLWQD
jgi:hypothetical protein